jgi:hypothetical protein
MLISLDLIECVNVFEVGALFGSSSHPTPADASRQEKAPRKPLAGGVI